MKNILASLFVLLIFGTPAALGGPGTGRYLRHANEWFAGAEAGEITDHILAWQTELGGWPKNVDTTLDPAAIVLDPAAAEATFDNRATTDELRFLARRFNATEDERCREAFARGLDYVLAAQYPSGGWPQKHPPGKGYKQCITFNDGAMVRLMEFLREVARDEAYKFVSAERRAAAQTAFDRGVQCVLKCQVRVDGRLTVWCAQHDERTFEPRPARSFELTSLSGGESVGIVELLMSLENPNAEVREAIEAAVAWFDAVRIKGRRIVDRNAKATGTGDRDRAMIVEPAAPSLWGRFYEIGTNRPLYANRDGVAQYAFNDVDDPLRSHYAWHGDWPRQLLDRDFPAWKRHHP